jgi:hypothetical protein
LICTKCRVDQEPSAFRTEAKKSGKTYTRKTCESCRLAARQTPEARQQQREQRIAKWGGNEAYRRMRMNDHHMRQYGITLDEKEEMLASQGGCAICGTRVPPRTRGWHTDHDHVTGKVRGILCSNCNLGLGYFQDNPEFLSEAINYLERSQL